MLSENIQILLSKYLPEDQAIKLDNELRKLVSDSNEDQVFDWCNTFRKPEIKFCENCCSCIIDVMDTINSIPEYGYCTNFNGKPVALTVPIDCEHYKKDIK